MTALPKTSAPAERDLMPLHGFGPLAVERIQAALAAAGLPALV